MSINKLWPTTAAAVLMMGCSWFGNWAKPTISMAELHSRAPLSILFPDQIGDWRIDSTTTNVPLSPDVAAQIQAIYTEVADRTYVNNKNQRMMVTVAYGRDQSDGFKVHRPEVCYAAQGFTVGPAVDATLDLGLRAIDVKHVDTTKGQRMEPVMYWVVIGDKVVNTPMRHKYQQIKYAIDGVIADGLLVRVSTISGNSTLAYEEQAAFVRQWIAATPMSQQPRLFGI